MINEKNVVSSMAMIFFLVCIFLPNVEIYAQDTTSIIGILKIPDSSHLQMLYTKDGSSLVGRIIEIGQSEIQFETGVGKITVPLAQIKEIKEIPQASIINGVYWYPNPNACRLYLTPTGRCLKKSTGYFAHMELFFPLVSYGLTDNISISGGMSLFPFIDINEQIFYFSSKVGLVARDKFALALGTTLIKIPSFAGDDIPLVGTFFGMGTFGSPDRSLTAGLGYGFVESNFADRPVFIIGGDYRITRNIAFVTENWVYPGISEPVISYGIRFFGEKLSVDLAFVNLLGGGIFYPGIPFVGFVFNF